MKSARSVTRVLLCTLIVSAVAVTVLLASKGKKSVPTGDLISCEMKIDLKG
jgi:hypothetical protein